MQRLPSQDRHPNPPKFPEHRCHSRESRIFASLPQNDLGNLIDTHRGNHEKVRVLDRLGKEVRLRLVREVGQPRRRVHQIHRRSPSRTSVVSMPFRYPRSFRTSRTGMISIRFLKENTLAFSPDRSPMPSRILCGITTWNFGGMVTVFMCHTEPRSIGVSRIGGIEDDARRPVNWMFSHGGTVTRRV